MLMSTVMVKFKVIFVILFAVLAVVISSKTALGGMEKEYYIRLGLPYQSFSGDFDGQSYYSYETDPNQWILVPKFDSTMGIGITVGQYGKKFTGELSFLYSTPDGTCGSLKLQDNSFQLINYDVKIYLSDLDKNKLVPFCQFGLGFHSFSIADGAYNNTDGSTSKASFSGISYDVGLGVYYKITSKLVFEGSIVLDCLKVDRIRGWGYNGEPEDDFTAYNRVISLGLNIGL